LRTANLVLKERDCFLVIDRWVEKLTRGHTESRLLYAFVKLTNQDESGFSRLLSIVTALTDHKVDAKRHELEAKVNLLLDETPLRFVERFESQVVSELMWTLLGDAVPGQRQLRVRWMHLFTRLSLAHTRYSLNSNSPNSHQDTAMQYCASVIRSAADLDQETENKIVPQFLQNAMNAARGEELNLAFVLKNLTSELNVTFLHEEFLFEFGVRASQMLIHLDEHDNLRNDLVLFFNTVDKTIRLSMGQRVFLLENLIGKFIPDISAEAKLSRRRGEAAEQEQRERAERSRDLLWGLIENQLDFNTYVPSFHREATAPPIYLADALFEYILRVSWQLRQNQSTPIEQLLSGLNDVRARDCPRLTRVMQAAHEFVIVRSLAQCIECHVDRRSYIESKRLQLVGDGESAGENRRKHIEESETLQPLINLLNSGREAAAIRKAQITALFIDQKTNQDLSNQDLLMYFLLNARGRSFLADFLASKDADVLGGWIVNWRLIYPKSVDLQRDFDAKVRRTLLSLEDTKAAELWKAEHMKVCPHCGLSIYKDIGCDIVVCGQHAHANQEKRPDGVPTQGCRKTFYYSRAQSYVPKQSLETRPETAALLAEFHYFSFMLQTPQGETQSPLANLYQSFRELFLPVLSGGNFSALVAFTTARIAQPTQENNRARLRMIFFLCIYYDTFVAVQNSPNEVKVNVAAVKATITALQPVLDLKNDELLFFNRFADPTASLLELSTHTRTPAGQKLLHCSANVVAVSLALREASPFHAFCFYNEPFGSFDREDLKRECKLPHLQLLQFSARGALLFSAISGPDVQSRVVPNCTQTQRLAVVAALFQQLQASWTALLTGLNYNPDQTILFATQSFERLLIAAAQPNAGFSSRASLLQLDNIWNTQVFSDVQRQFVQIKQRYERALTTSADANKAHDRVLRLQATIPPRMQYTFDTLQARLQLQLQMAEQAGEKFTCLTQFLMDRRLWADIPLATETAWLHAWLEKSQAYLHTEADIRNLTLYELRRQYVAGLPNKSDQKVFNQRFDSLIENWNRYHDKVEGVIVIGACERVYNFMKLDEQTPVHNFIQFKDTEEGNLASLLTGKLSQIQNRFVDSLATVTEITPGKTELPNIMRTSNLLLGVGHTGVGRDEFWKKYLFSQFDVEDKKEGYSFHLARLEQRVIHSALGKPLLDWSHPTSRSFLFRNEELLKQSKERKLLDNTSQVMDRAKALPSELCEKLPEETMLKLRTTCNDLGFEETNDHLEALVFVQRWVRADKEKKCTIQSGQSIHDFIQSLEIVKEFQDILMSHSNKSHEFKCSSVADKVSGYPMKYLLALIDYFGTKLLDREYAYLAFPPFIKVDLRAEVVEELEGIFLSLNANDSFSILSRFVQDLESADVQKCVQDYPSYSIVDTLLDLLCIYEDADKAPLSWIAQVEKKRLLNENYVPFLKFCKTILSKFRMTLSEDVSSFCPYREMEDEQELQREIQKHGLPVDGIGENGGEESSVEYPSADDSKFVAATGEIPVIDDLKSSHVGMEDSEHSYSTKYEIGITLIICSLVPRRRRPGLISLLTSRNCRFSLRQRRETRICTRSQRFC